MKLKLFTSVLQKSLSLLLSKEPGQEGLKDVEEGHFVVFAVDGDRRKRFVVDLKYLSNPAFLRLLELAEEEYGFKQKGALTVPCRPEELQKIVEDRRKQKGGEWNFHIIASY